jgi:prepilin signal peptidase PulO-like enzyme (type II secretory pathway)
MSIGFLWILFLALGIIVGSFLNVVILRYHTGKPIGGKARSMCLSCTHPLSFTELIPIFSFLVQKGRCTKCESKLRWQYPLVELATGLLFVGIFFMWDHLLLISLSLFGLIFSVHAVIWAVLVVIFVYDLYHTIIPNRFVYIFIFFSFLIAVLSYFETSMISGELVRNSALLDLVAGPLFLIPFFMLWDISDGKWIGLGDGKLALGIGWFLGFTYGISALILAFWIGAVIAILYLLHNTFILKKKRKDISHQIPFGPFMIVGCAVVYFIPIDILHIGMLFGL